LTNTTLEDLERIVEQRLTPLYISVHVTDPELRKLMLGIKFDDHLFEKIDYLTANGIELNCQIVLCPELNDGVHLDKTIADLKRYYPMVRSIAIVPVGLTQHRKNLFPIKPVTREYALKVIRETDERRRKLREELGSSFVYLSDEFYIRTDLPIPEREYYEGFFQLENGVGLTRDFIDRFEAEYSQLQHSGRHLKSFSLVTGLLGEKVLQTYFMPRLNRIPGLNFKLHPVVNRFYGPSITVAGLLVGADIYHTLREQSTGDVIVLPPRVLNDDGVFIDDWTVPQLEEKLGKRVIVFPESFGELFEVVEEYETTNHSHNRASQRR